MRLYIAVFSFILLLSACAAPPTIGGRLVEQVVEIPGPGNTTLVSAWFRPAGNGPFPLIVLSHGSPPNSANRATMGRYRPLAPIEALVDRGFAVFVPMRRGFGATGGRFEEGYGSCRDPDYYRAGMEAAHDILAALKYARAQAFVRANRVLLVGQSVGGFASVAAASQRPPGLIGVVNFSGGSGGNPETRPGEPCAPERMAEAFARWGATTAVPELWHYAENDRFFAPRHVRAWFSAFQKAGGRGRLVVQPPYGRDGHGLFNSPDAVPIWTPEFDRFVAEVGIR